MNTKMIKLNTGIIIGKAICEIRVKPKLIFYSKLYEIGSELEDIFSDWQTSGLDIKFLNKEKGIILAIIHKRWSLFYEKPDKIDDFKNIAITNYSNMLKKYNFNFIERLGIRIQTFIDHKMSFKEFTNLFNLKTHSSPIQKLNCFKDKVVDDALVINTEDDSNYKFHFELGGVHKQELITKLNFEIFKQKEIFDKFPENSLWCDIDAGIRNIKSDQISEKINIAINKIFQYTNEVIDSILK